MNNKTFGYARVSTKEQSLDRQISAIKEYCKEITDRDIFADKQSGKDMERNGYQALKQCLRSGDTLIIKELDRLGRNKEAIKKELDYFKENKIRVKILNIPTTLMELPAGQEWVFDMINNILIEVLGAIAEEERAKLLQRQTEGIAEAKKRGVKMGRKEIDFPCNWEEMYKSWKNDEVTATYCFQTMGITKSAFYRLVKRYESK